MDREAWHAAIRGVAKSRTRLSEWTELNWISTDFVSISGFRYMNNGAETLTYMLKCIPLLVFKLQKSLRACYPLMCDTKLLSYSCESPFLKKKKNQNFKPMKRLRLKSIFCYLFQAKKLLNATPTEFLKKHKLHSSTN